MAGGSAYPIVFLVCNHCAYIRQFMAIQAGIFPSDLGSVLASSDSLDGLSGTQGGRQNEGNEKRRQRAANPARHLLVKLLQAKHLPVSYLRRPAQPMGNPLPNPDRGLHQMGHPLPLDEAGGMLAAEIARSVRPGKADAQAPGSDPGSDQVARRQAAPSGLSVSGFHHTRLVHTYPTELVFRSISEDQLDILEEGTPSVLLDGLCGLCVSLCIGIFPNIVMPLLAFAGSGGEEVLSQRESILSLLLLAGLLGVAMTLPGLIARRRRVRQLISKLRCQKTG